MQPCKSAVRVLGCLVVALWVVACGPAGGGTQVIRFDPVSIAIDGDGPVLAATCQTSVAVPRPGVFRCTLKNGAVDDPCFVVEDNTLLCGPDPVQASYQAIVTATDPLPVGDRVPDEPFAFYLDLGADKPLCGRRADPFTVSGYIVTHACQTPGTWIVGELDTSAATWMAQYITTDAQGTRVTHGPERSHVARAWVY